MNVPPDPPWPHKLLTSDAAFWLYRRIGRPPITLTVGNVVTKLRRGPGDSVQCTTTQRRKPK